MAHGDKKRSRFPETRWSLVERAAASDADVSSAALSELLVLYTPVLRTFLIESRRVQADSVDDLIHDFVADKVLARKLVHHADRARGRFRNLLVKALTNFVTARNIRRNARQSYLVDVEELGGIPSDQEVDRFDQEWVRQVLRDSLRLMEEECRTRDRMDVWKVFRMRILNPILHDKEAVGYGELVSQLGIETPRQAINLLATAKSCFRRHLRKAVGRYVLEDEIEEEIRALREIVGQ